MLHITTVRAVFCDWMSLKRTPSRVRSNMPTLEFCQVWCRKLSGHRRRTRSPSSFPLPRSALFGFWLVIKVCVAGINRKDAAEMELPESEIVKFVMIHAPVNFESILFYMHHWKEMKVSELSLQFFRHFTLCRAITNSVARILSCLTKHDSAPHTHIYTHTLVCMHMILHSNSLYVWCIHSLWVSEKSHLFMIYLFQQEFRLGSVHFIQKHFCRFNSTACLR